ncbi:MAG: GumC family protein [Beijerinckiaceae bacterium]|nr:GumC family protein [Beijerinckiaceae bacterium]
MSNEFARVPPSGRDLDLSDVWRAIVAGKKLIFAVTAAFFLIALVYVLVASPRYTGEAKVLVENQEGYLTRQERADNAPDEQAVGSQVQVVMSRDLARQAIRQLNLSGNPEFDPIAGGGGLIRQIVGLITGSRASTREDRIFEEYYKRLTVFALPKSRVLSIEFQSRDPALAARAANVIADLFIQMQADAKREQARSSAQALGTQVGMLRAKVAEAENQVEAFRSKSGLMMGANNSTLPTQQLAEINAQLATARTAQADSQARARLLREAIRGGRLNEVPDIANNELVRRVSEQRVTLRGQLALESRTLGPEHPRTKDLTAQIASVEGELRALADKTARTLENDARIAGSRVDFLLAAVERQRLAVGGFGDDEVRLRELEREARLIKEQLEQSTQRWQEAVARESSKATPGDARVISRAVEPEKPTSPKKILALFAGIGGLAMSVFFVVARAMIAGPAPAMAAPAQVPAMRRESAPVEGAAPVLTVDAAPAPIERVNRAMGLRADGAEAGATAPQATSGDHAPRGDAAVDLAARMLSLPVRTDGLLTLVSGASQKVASDGAHALGRALAKGGRAVLVDLSSAGGRSEAGLSDVIDGSAMFGHVLQRDAHSRLHIIARGRTPVEIGDDLDHALAALSRTYDFILVAAAGEDDVDLALGLAGAVDRCVVAHRAGLGREAVQSLVEALTESGALAIDLLDAPVGAVRRRAVAA